jgi:hypothetical protein
MATDPVLAAASRFSPILLSFAYDGALDTAQGSLGARPEIRALAAGLVPMLNRLVMEADADAWNADEARWWALIRRQRLNVVPGEGGP